MVTTIFSLFINVTIMVTNQKTVFYASKSKLGNRLLGPFSKIGNSG